MHDIEKATMSAIEPAAPTLPPELFQRWTAYLDAKPKTVATYTRSIRQFARFIKERGIDAPTRETVLDFREAETAAGKSAATVNAYLVAVKLFFRWAAQEGIYPNIAEHVKGRKVSHTFKKDYLTSRQARALLATCDRSTVGGRRDYALLSLMMCTGIRTIEAARANVGDIRTAGENVVLYVEGKGRDDRQEYVKLEPPVEEALRAYITAEYAGKNPPEAAPLFCSTARRNDGGRMTTRSISRIVKGHLLDAGLKSSRLTAHSLRHTAATLMLKGGAKITEVQQILRHSNISTTMIYSHALERAANTGESKAARAIFG